MLGTQDIDTGDVNFLYLPTPTTLYLLKKEEWKGVDVNDWEFTGDEGNFLGAKIGKLKIYKKDYPSGRHRIDNKSALYLFDAPGNSLQEYHSFQTFELSMRLFYNIMINLILNQRSSTAESTSGQTKQTIMGT